jgi:hypothetical protein
MVTVLLTPVVELADLRYVSKGYTAGKRYDVWALVNDAGTYKLGLVNDHGSYTFEDFYMFKHVDFRENKNNVEPPKKEVPVVAVPKEKAILVEKAKA